MLSSSIPGPEDWPRLRDDELGELAADEVAQFKELETMGIHAERAALADIVDNCTVRPQFAKTYRVLRRDKRKSVEQMKRQFSSVSPAMRSAMLVSYERIVDYKLLWMASLFKVRWAESIENWAGKEGGTLDHSGCALTFLVGIAAVTGIVFVLA